MAGKGSKRQDTETSGIPSEEHARTGRKKVASSDDSKKKKKK